MAEIPPPSLPHPSQKSLKRLDWFVFLVADVQTGFGPFVAVYLTSQKWTQIEIGLVLTVAGLVSLLGQIPGGALVDAVRSERMVAAVAVSLIATSALVYATFPIFPAVLVAATLKPPGTRPTMNERSALMFQDDSYDGASGCRQWRRR